MVAWIIQKMQMGLTNNQILELYNAEGKEYGTKQTLQREIRKIRQIVNTYAEKADVKPANIEKTTLLEKETTENDLSIAIRSYEIRDIAGLRKWANIGDDWVCISQKIRSSQNASNPWHIVQGTFAPKKREDFTAAEIALRCKEIVEKYQICAPKMQKQPLQGEKDDYMLVLSFPDVHLGNINYKDTDTLETSRERFRGATNDFLEQTRGYTLSEIIFTVGSDYFTINADKNETKKGTGQDVNVFYDHLYSFGAELVIETIQTLRLHADKIKVAGILGNHDEQAVVWLMICLKHVFRDCEDVEVDWTYGQRKYYRFGSTAFAFTHKLRKDLQSLPLIMMQEMIDQNLLDDGVKYFEIMAGDRHIPSKQELPAETTNQKITQRVLSSLTDNSRWAADNFGAKTIEAQAFLYHKDKGIKSCMIYRP